MNAKPNQVLSVFGLGNYTTERDLKDKFSKYGSVTNVKIIYDGKVSDLM
jgi:RNA recognition motif-containing protein